MFGGSTTPTTQSDRFGPIHQIILFYSKSGAYRHRSTYTPYTKGYVDNYYNHKDENGRRFRESDIHGSGTRNGQSGKPWRGYDPTSFGRHWAVPRALVKELGIDPKLPLHEKLDALFELGYLHLPKSGLPTYRRHLHKGLGVLLQDVWSYQPYTKGVLHGTNQEIDHDVRWLEHRGKKERMGYPTQKPIGLLQRIIRASSDEGDVVLDPFCGCGTTVHASILLKRKFVGIDISPFAIDLVRSRRLKDSSIPINGIPVEMEGARRMASEKPFDFEKWAVTRIPGLAPNSRQTGDSGIDGRGSLVSGGGVLAQVKGGKFVLTQLRDFLHVMGREKAEFGVFITLDPITSKQARSEAAKAGIVEMGASRYQRIQLWSIADYFDGRLPALPPMADPYTGHPIQSDLFA